MNAEEKDLVYSKNVIEFLTVANEFCLFVEKGETYSKEDIVHYMLKICPLIYLKGSLLPTIEENESEVIERYMTEEYWESIFKIIKEKLGKDDKYWVLANNEIGECVPRMASIAENLADIYQDMKDFVMLYQKGTHAAKENAVAECKILFETHWGHRILSAHKALHESIYNDNSEEEFYENDN